MVNHSSAPRRCVKAINDWHLWNSVIWSNILCCLFIKGKEVQTSEWRSWKSDERGKCLFLAARVVLGSVCIRPLAKYCRLENRSELQRLLSTGNFKSFGTGRGLQLLLISIICILRCHSVSPAFSFIQVAVQVQFTHLSAAVFSVVEALVISVTIKSGRETTLDTLTFFCFNICKHINICLSMISLILPSCQWCMQVRVSPEMGMKFIVILFMQTHVLTMCWLNPTALCCSLLRRRCSATPSRARPRSRPPAASRMGRSAMARVSNASFFFSVFALLSTQSDSHTLKVKYHWKIFFSAAPKNKTCSGFSAAGSQMLTVALGVASPPPSSPPTSLWSWRLSY